MLETNRCKLSKIQGTDYGEIKRWVPKWPELEVVQWNNKLIPFVRNKKVYVRK